MGNTEFIGVFDPDTVDPNKVAFGQKPSPATATVMPM
jgi:hypothetical protein